MEGALAAANEEVAALRMNGAKEREAGALEVAALEKRLEDAGALQEQCAALHLELAGVNKDLHAAGEEVVEARAAVQGLHADGAREREAAALEALRMGEAVEAADKAAAEAREEAAALKAEGAYQREGAALEALRLGEAVDLARADVEGVKMVHPKPEINPLNPKLYIPNPLSTSFRIYDMLFKVEVC